MQSLSKTGAVIVGRSLADLFASGHVVPAGGIRGHCNFCQDPLVFSPEMPRRVAEAQEKGHNVVYSCNPCAMLLAAAYKGRANVEISEHARGQVKVSAKARDALKALLELTKEDPPA